MHPGVPSVTIFGQSNKLLLLLKALTAEFKVIKARVFMTSRDSYDQVVRNTLPDVNTGGKRDVSNEIEEMESRLEHKEIATAVQTDRTCLGSMAILFSNASDFEKRNMVINEIR